MTELLNIKPLGESLKQESESSGKPQFLSKEEMHEALQDNTEDVLEETEICSPKNVINSDVKRVYRKKTVSLKKKISSCA